MTHQPIFPTGKLPLEYMQRLLAQYASSNGRLIAGPGVGEDVAVIDNGDRYMVIKTDPITFATDQIGWYAVHVNANDVATSGAQPLWMLNTVLLPEGHTTPALVEGIFAQIHQACSALGITPVGGHTEVVHALSRPIVVGVMIGEAPKEALLTTSGARVGDHIVLVKSIPIEATAIIAREKAPLLRSLGVSADTITRAQNFLFDPGISVLEPARLAASWPGVHAMHDPTEGGLATGLHELAMAAGIGLEVQHEAISLAPEGRILCEKLGLDPLGTIASGALVVAVAAEHSQGLLRRLADAGYAAAIIAEATPPQEGVWLLRHGQREPLPLFERDEIARIF
jgi:hydrogenase expression/formation protein HypE